MKDNRTLDEFIEDEKERIIKEVRSAVKDMENVGRGFVVVGRTRPGYQSVFIKHILWPEVEGHLKKIGARLEDKMIKSLKEPKKKVLTS